MWYHYHIRYLLRPIEIIPENQISKLFTKHGSHHHEKGPIKLRISIIQWWRSIIGVNLINQGTLREILDELHLRPLPSSILKDALTYVNASSIHTRVDGQKMRWMLAFPPMFPMPYKALMFPILTSLEGYQMSVIFTDKTIFLHITYLIRFNKPVSLCENLNSKEKPTFWLSFLNDVDSYSQRTHLFQWIPWDLNYTQLQLPDSGGRGPSLPFSSHPYLMWPGTHFSNGLWVHDWNLKFQFPLIFILMIQSSHNFAHVMTAELSWHVQNCALIWSLFFP